MRCPYCGMLMETGTIQSPYEISWLKGTKRHIFGASELHPESVVLSERSFLGGSAVLAYLCRPCEKVIIDLKDNAGDLNKR